MASMQIRHDRHGKRRYRVQVRAKGTSSSKTFRNKREAERWARETEDRAELHLSSPMTQATIRTVAEMIDRYCAEILPDKARNTQCNQYGQLMFWRRFIGHRTLAEATAPVIAKGKAELEPRGGATINCYLAALQHCFVVAVKEWQWLPSNPVRDVVRRSMSKSRTRKLAPKERASLLFYSRLVPYRLMETVIVVALSTGARKDEIRTMKFADYNRQASTVILDHTKNGERRTVRLFGKAAQLMADLYDNRQSGQLFFFPSHKNPRKPVDFRYSWELALEKAEIPNFCFHDLRHSAASYLAEQGATLADIKEILGHKSIQTTQKYTHLTESHTSKIVQRMNLSIF